MCTESGESRACFRAENNPETLRQGMWRSSKIIGYGSGKLGGEGWGLMVDGYDCWVRGKWGSQSMFLKGGVDVIIEIIER